MKFSSMSCSIFDGRHSTESSRSTLLHSLTSTPNTFSHNFLKLSQPMVMDVLMISASIQPPTLVTNLTFAIFPVPTFDDILEENIDRDSLTLTVRFILSTSILFWTSPKTSIFLNLIVAIVILVIVIVFMFYFFPVGFLASLLRLIMIPKFTYFQISFTFNSQVCSHPALT